MQEISEYLLDAFAVKFTERLPALTFTADQFEDLPLFLGRGEMGYDFGDVRRVHPSQHLGKVRDGSASQQFLHGLDDDVRFRLPTVGLIT